MSQSQFEDCLVDIVLVIDGTGSMSPVIDMVKQNALKFSDDLLDELKAKNRHVSAMRIKVIVYRDYYVPGEEHMVESPFFVMPMQAEEFQRFVKGINAEGGGDEPENGLEALSLAIKSPWSTEGPKKRRYLTVVWTDASCHPLEKDGKPATYPTGMPANFNELTDMWSMSQTLTKTTKRIVLFAPDAYPWTNIATDWEGTVHVSSQAGKGMEEHNYKFVLDTIARSV